MTDTGTAEQRLDTARAITQAAAEKALRLFRARGELEVEIKGLQDWVSNADRSVEDDIRAALVSAFPEDGIIGEEHGWVESQSGYTWIIDPIDGTTNFVHGTPGWCVVVACVQENRPLVGVICDPIANETFACCRGHSATLNGATIHASAATSLRDGSVAVGHSMRVAPQPTLQLLTKLLADGGMFYRSGSGALNLAYVAAGRLVGYCEPHMNAWDCVAGLLLIEEAGGRVQPYDMQSMLLHGGSVVAAAAGVYDRLTNMTDAAYAD